MLIKHKLIFSSTISILGLLIMLFLLGYSSESSQRDLKLSKSIGAINQEALQLRHHEKDFLVQKDLKYADSFNKAISTLNNNIKNFEHDLLAMDRDNAQTTQLKSIVLQYQKHFQAIVETQKIIGLTPQTGLYGRLRDAVHNAETLIGQDNFQLLSLILQLRRNEKDFMLRNDLKYRDKFVANMAKTQQILTSNNIGIQPAQATQINNALTVYQNAFISLLNEQVKLGLTPKLGRQLQMRETIHQINDVIMRLTEKTEKTAQQHIESVNMMSYNILLFTIVASIIISGCIGRMIVNAINNIKDSMHNVADANNLTIKVTALHKDKLGDMANAFNIMLHNFQSLISSVNESVISVNHSTKKLLTNIEQANQCVDSQIKETDMLATVEYITNNTTDTAKTAQKTHTTIIGELMSKCKEEAERSSVQATKAGNILDQINNDVSSIMNMNTAISSAIQKQSPVASEVNQHVINIRGVTQHANHSTEKNKNLSQELSPQAI